MIRLGRRLVDRLAEQLRGSESSRWSGRIVERIGRSGLAEIGRSGSLIGLVEIELTGLMVA